MTDHKIPGTAEQLIVLLDQWFPERAPELGQTMEQVWFNAGSRHVVRHLQGIQKREADEALEPFSQESFT